MASWNGMIRRPQNQDPHRITQAPAQPTVPAHTSSVIPVHTAVAGRARFHLPALHHDEVLGQRLEALLHQTDGIARARANALTGNLLIEFAPALSLTQIARTIAAHLDTLSGTAPSQEISPDEPPAGGKITSLERYRARRNPQRPEIHPVENTQLLRPWHARGVTQVLESLTVSATDGLSSKEALDRLRRWGPNRLPRTTHRSELSILTEQFMSLPVGLLAASAVVSVLTGGVADAIVIMGVVAINAGIGFVTERQSERIIASLDDTGPHHATVLRNAAATIVPVDQLVAGDILLLTPGTRIPADARLLRTDRLSVDEAALTGESMPVPKSAAVRIPDDAPLGDRANMIHMGTHVTGGSAVAAVVATGSATELGQIQALVGESHAPDTPMELQLDKMSTQLALLSGAVCTGVFAVGLLRGYGMLEMLKSAISLAVAAVPEGLPTVATTTLALGIRDMRRKNVLVRHLDAVETLGSVQVICLDKTGTLTMNRMAALAVHNGLREIRIEDDRFTIDGQAFAPLDDADMPPLLQTLVLCNEAEYDAQHNGRITGSFTESALLELASDAGLDVPALRHAYPRLKIDYRSEDRHYMQTLHRAADGTQLLAVKGSPTEVLTMCDSYLHEGSAKPLGEHERNMILSGNDAMAGESLRVLGVAYARTDADTPFEAQPALTWLGLVGLADPVRPGMPELMSRFHDAGISTVMITGDQAGTAYTIGKALNLSNGGPLEILESSRLETMDAELLAGLVKRVQVFARVSPANKLQVVRALQSGGAVVAMTGDGINDGPALKAADIGVAMGDSGTDVARSVAGVILEDDNLQTMVVAVRQGRTIYNNIRKALQFLLSTNFSEIEVMLAAVTAGVATPLNPMQLLWINLITDIFPGLALALEPPEEDVLAQPPRRPEEPIIRNRDLMRLGMQSAVITTGTLTSYAYALLRYGPGPRASTHAFMSLTLAQLLHALSCRSERHSLFEMRRRPSNPYLNIAIGGSVILQLSAIALPPLRRLLGITPVGLLDALVIAAGSAAPLLINEAIKSATHTSSPALHSSRETDDTSSDTGEQAT
jgi:Ca2+-transporting ATPase